MARIGIDATALPPRPFGAGVYIIELIRSLSKVINEHELVVFAQPSGRKLVELSEVPGVDWVIVPEQPPARRLVWEQTRFPSLIRQAGIELLHSPHYTRPLRLSCASVVTFHDMTFFLFPHLHTRSKRLFFPAMMRQSARLADKIITDSESTRQDAIRILKLPPEKLVTVPFGVASRFRPVADAALLAEVQQRYNLPAEFLLYVGLVEPRKNVPLLIRAFRKVVDRHPSIHLVVAGRRGWMVDEVFSLVEDLKLKGRVIFTGYVAQEDLPVVYNLATVFVYPSLYEGFGLPVLEAMACGTPVISTEISSIPEFSKEAAWLIPPGDESGLVEAALSLLADAGRRAKLAQAGLAQARQFTWEQTARRTLSVYEAVLEGRNKEDSNR